MTHVSAVILRDGAGRILICRRGPGGSCAFLWEFPGGKVETGEDPAVCAVRECREELGVEVVLTVLFGTAHYDYPERSIDFTFYDGVIAQGVPEQRVHTELRWVRPEELGDYSFCPADVEIVRRLAAGE